MHLEPSPNNSVEIVEESNIDLIGRYAGLLSATEISCGGVLHAFHIPFSGSLLSLNQIFILTHASLKKNSNKSQFNSLSISCIAALMKTLTPIGKKMTPILAISMQGALFNIGIFIFGYSILGCLIGAVLASLWAFIQSLLLYYLIFGTNFFDAITSLIKDLSWYTSIQENSIYLILVGLVVIKVIFAMALVCMTPLLPQSWMTSYINKISRFKTQDKPTKKIRMQKPIFDALKDLCRPTFLLALIGTTLFLFWSNRDYHVIFIGLLRSLAIGFICFFCMRWLPLEKIIVWLESRSKNTFSIALKSTLEKIRNI